MDKRVVFAVAGSGKTSTIIDKLHDDSRCLIVTYTENNILNLKERVYQKFGCLPDGIRIYTYYTFLYSFCFRPILGHVVKTKGISWKEAPRYAKKNSVAHYRDGAGRLYGNRIAKILIENKCIDEVTQRIEKYFDTMFIDEVQDFAGNDFNFLCKLAKANVEQLLVGDFFQHTFDTSRDGSTNKNLHNDFAQYHKKFTSAGYTVDLDALSHSYRCSPSVCGYVTDKIGIEIYSHRNDVTAVEVIDCPERAIQLFHCTKTVKLFYQASNSYPGFTNNWGATKGQDCFSDVCVVLNPKTYKLLGDGKLSELPPTTKNKLYVACTRACGNLYFVKESIYKPFKKK